MKKIYKKLSEEQISRGVVFSSTLSTHQTEQIDDCVHEVFEGQTKQEREEMIARLLNDSFFDCSPWRYNIIRR